MGDCMPKEQEQCIKKIQNHCLESTNMTEDEAWNFAFRCWQLGYVNTNLSWIRCEEQLPDTFDYVIVATREGGRTIAHRVPNQKSPWYDLHSENVPNVIAWQRIPAACVSN